MTQELNKEALKQAIFAWEGSHFTIKSLETAIQAYLNTAKVTKPCQKCGCDCQEGNCILDPYNRSTAKVTGFEKPIEDAYKILDAITDKEPMQGMIVSVCIKSLLRNMQAALAGGSHE